MRSSNKSTSWINSKQRIANCVSNWLTCVPDEESLWILREAVSPYETAHLLVSSWPGPGDTRLFSVCKKLWDTLSRWVLRPAAARVSRAPIPQFAPQFCARQTAPGPPPHGTLADCHL